MNTVATASRLASVESEQALLGALLLDPERLDDVEAGVAAADFYRPDHGRLFDLLRHMRRSGEHVDPVSVGERVLRGGQDEAFGGYGYVIGLTERVPARVNCAYYARTIAELGALRRGVRELEDLRTRMLSGEVGRVEASQELAVVADAMGGKADDDEWVSLGDAVDAELRAIEGRSSGTAGGRDVCVPLAALADVVPAFRPGQLVIVAGRPGMGKSALALQIAETACAVDPGVAAAVYSLEMPPDSLARRTLAPLMGATVNDMLSGVVEQAAWDRVVAAGDSYRLPIDVNRKSSVTVEDIVAGTIGRKRHHARAGRDLRVLVVDYIGLVKVSKSVQRGNLPEKIAHVTRALKSLAVGEGIVVVALSQLNRAVESRADKHPQIADLRDSGSIEQDADVILFPFRPAVYDTERGLSEAEIDVAKYRDGSTGRVTCGWDGPTMRFFDRDPLEVKR